MTTHDLPPLPESFSGTHYTKPITRFDRQMGLAQEFWAYARLAVEQALADRALATDGDDRVN